jgi:hypothetical protein
LWSHNRELVRQPANRVQGQSRYEVLPPAAVEDHLALGVIEAAKQAAQLRPGQTVIEATSGNTGIGLASVHLLGGKARPPRRDMIAADLSRRPTRQPWAISGQ